MYVDELFEKSMKKMKNIAKLKLKRMAFESHPFFVLKNSE